MTSRSIAGARVYMIEVSCRYTKRDVFRYAYRDGEACGHSVEVIRVFAHHDDLWNYGVARPPDSEDFSELLQVFGSCFPNRENGVTQPAHAKRAELIIEEILAKLACEQWDVLNYG